jgi:hypothetical protein
VSYLRGKLEAFRARSLLFQTAVVTLSLLAGFAMVVGGLSFAIVSATCAVFPAPAEAGAAAEETLATAEEPGQSGPAPSSSPGGRKVARTSGPLAKRPGEPRPSRGDTTE